MGMRKKIDTYVKLLKVGKEGPSFLLLMGFIARLVFRTMMVLWP